MDPEFLQSAMAAMNKMTPLQMSQMQEQMKNIPQSVLQDQMKMFQNMTPDQQRMAGKKAQDLDPSDIVNQGSQFASGSGWSELKEAEDLKKEGNRLHGLGQYSSAIKKYELASNKVTGEKKVLLAILNFQPLKEFGTAIDAVYAGRFKVYWRGRLPYLEEERRLTRLTLVDIATGTKI
jgi:hypothetical protein